MSEAKGHEQQSDGSADFDFFIGSWKVQHRRLVARLQGSQEWEEFAGTTVMRPVLGGLGNIDENVMERGVGRMEGMSVRLFDPQAQQWHIYWADSANGGPLQTPMVGEFKNGQGEFYAHESFGGKAILSRFIWSGIDATSCRWEQAFSTDGGRTWETNWIMDFTRNQ